MCILVYSERGARVKCAQVSNYFRARWAAGTEQNGLLYHNSMTLCPCTLQPATMEAPSNGAEVLAHSEQAA